MFSAAGPSRPGDGLPAPLTRVVAGRRRRRWRSGAAQGHLARCRLRPAGSAARSAELRRGRLVITTVVPSALGVAVTSPNALISVEPRPRSRLAHPLPPLAVVADRDPHAPSAIGGGDVDERLGRFLGVLDRVGRRLAGGEQQVVGLVLVEAGVGRASARSRRRSGGIDGRLRRQPPLLGRRPEPVSAARTGGPGRAVSGAAARRDGRDGGREGARGGGARARRWLGAAAGARRPARATTRTRAISSSARNGLAR